MNRKPHRLDGRGGAAVALVGCATAPTDAEVSAKATQMLKTSFKARGQAGLDRLDQDEMQKLCTEYATAVPPKDVVQQDRDGEFRGDPSGRRTASSLATGKNGEKIAQEGRGKQYSDDPKGPVGGNCYACHQLAPQESLVRHDRPVALPVRQEAAATTTRCASTRTARSGMPRPTTRAR